MNCEVGRTGGSREDRREYGGRKGVGKVEGVGVD